MKSYFFILVAVLVALYAVIYGVLWVGSGGFNVETSFKNYARAKEYGLVVATGRGEDASNRKCIIETGDPWVERTYMRIGINWDLTYRNVRADNYVYVLPKVRVRCPAEGMLTSLLVVRSPEGEIMAKGITLDGDMFFSASALYKSINIAPATAVDAPYPGQIIYLRRSVTSPATRSAFNTTFWK